MKFILLASIIILGSKSTHSQPSSLDYSFGKKGFVKPDVGINTIYRSTVKKILTLSDGTIYFIFETDNGTLITKKRANGTTDSTYGSNGYSKELDANQALHCKKMGKLW